MSQRIKLSVDDGSASDVRLFGLARKYNIETVFYWPVEWHSLAHENGYEPLSFNDAKMIAKSCEIGSHSVTHRHLTRIPDKEAMYEIDSSQKILKKVFNQPIRKFAPPRGYTNERLTEYTLKRYDSQRLTRGDGLVHIHPDSGANDNMPWLLALQQQMALRKDRDVELWCHSYDLDKYDLWEELELCLKSI